MSSSLVIRIDAGHSPSRTFQISDPIVLRRVIFLIDNLGLSPEYGDFTIDQALAALRAAAKAQLHGERKLAANKVKMESEWLRQVDEALDGLDDA